MNMVSYSASDGSLFWNGYRYFWLNYWNYDYVYY